MKMRLTKEGRRHLYLTRQMLASGDDVNIDPQSVDVVRALGYAEDIPAEPAQEAAPKRRGRPPRQAAAEELPKEAPKPERPKPSPAMSKQEETAALEKQAHEPEESDDLKDKTRDELKKLAEARGVELPSGYVSHDKLVDLVGEADEEDGA